jgi:hypothetical protein
MQQYVPLFLTKEDLDVAVSGAYRQRNAAQISAVKDKVRASTRTCTHVWDNTAGCYMIPSLSSVVD